ncbi:MAG: TIGR02206 family membrane protein [Rhizomicrobium sp.]
MTPFVNFGTSHLTALGLILAAALLLIAFAKGNILGDKTIRWSLAALLVVNWSMWMLLLYERGWLDIGNEIPLNLCDWATAVTFLALVNPVQKLYELAYFWATCGTVQALITPDCAYDFPNVQFILFFIYHGGIIVGVAFLTFGVAMRPYPISLVRVAGWSLFYAMVAGAADWLLGTNYGFLRAKPANASLLDYMSPWPWYLPELLIAGVLFMLLWYAPFALVDFLYDRKLRGNSSV